MGQICVEFDSTLKQSDIIIQLVSTSHEEAGEDYTQNQADVQQTSVYGIQAPLIQINHNAIDPSNVIEFSLKSINTLPEVSLTVKDGNKLIQSLDNVGMDNELRIQILPRFDEAYKKINLTFLLNNININNNIIRATGVYKIPKFTSSLYKAFGEINTYDLFKQSATESELGFATNVKANDADKRFVYCPYKSWQSVLDTEIGKGGSQTEIYDYWVDFWNNLNLVDIYDRYNNKDNEKDLQIWVATQLKEMSEGVKVDPVKTLAMLTNHPYEMSSELFVKDYKIKNKTGMSKDSGTDKVYSCYMHENKEVIDTLIQDGDVKKDIFTKYEYLGEVCGSYNYLLQPRLREAFLQKMKSETIEVTLRSPLLALMRGHKVNFAWYLNDDFVRDKMNHMKDMGLINEVEAPVPIPEADGPETSGYMLDKKVSGQYMILGSKIGFANGEWNYTLILTRPASDKPKLIPDEENGAI